MIGGEAELPERDMPDQSDAVDRPPVGPPTDLPTGPPTGLPVSPLAGVRRRRRSPGASARAFATSVLATFAR